MITPARRKTLYEDISNQILEMISQGRWKEGERIPGEIELSNMFEVSRNSIRESIKSLEVIGILKAKSGSGTYVSSNASAKIKQLQFTNLPGDESSIVEIMESRLVMEPGIVRMATERATKRDFAELHEILDLHEKALKEKNYDFNIGFAFHAALFRIAGNSILIAFVDQLKDKLVEARGKIFFKHVDYKVLMEEWEEHRAILGYMEAGEKEQAAAAIEKHIAESLARLNRVRNKA